MTERITSALRRIAGGHPEGQVVVVSHGGALNLALGYFLEGTYRGWPQTVDNCSVTRLVLAPEPEILAFNLVGHLSGI